MKINWSKISEEGRSWYTTIRGNLKAPCFLILTGMTSLGEDNFFVYNLTRFILKKINLELPAYPENLWVIFLKDIIAVLLIIFGCYILKRRIFPETRPKCILVMHEILKVFDKNELKEVLSDYKVKFIRLNFSKYFRGGELTEIKKVFELHKKKLAKISGGKLIYYGQAHIPLTVYSGFALGAKAPNVLEKDHTSGIYYRTWEDGEEQLGIVVKLPNNVNSATEEVAISLSFSVGVRDEQVKEKLGDSIPIAKIGMERPTLRSTKGKAEVDSILSEYRKLVENLKNQSPRLRKIHLFIASPPSIPFKIGAMLSETHDPELIVYNWTNKTGYKWGISIQSGMIV